MELKKEGLGDTGHRTKIPLNYLECMYRLLNHVFELMDMNVIDDPEAFAEKLNCIPQKWKENYHYIFQYGTIFIVLSAVSF